MKRDSAKETVIVNIRLPPDIVEWADSLVEKKLFKTRSDVIRHFTRQYVIENRGND